jgi:hypothetical protein
MDRKGIELSTMTWLLIAAVCLGLASLLAVYIVKNFTLGIGSSNQCKEGQYIVNNEFGMPIRCEPCPEDAAKAGCSAYQTEQACEKNPCSLTKSCKWEGGCKSA